ncbi:DUF3224 domain-containing protein [Actinokineospora sp. 24-640]
MHATGTFTMDTWAPQPDPDDRDGVAIGTTLIAKTFTGAVTGTSRFTMHQVTTAVPTSAAYVAFERVEATVDGRHGSFVLHHSASMSTGAQHASITVVPDSGTGALEGIAGEFAITKDDEGYRYAFDYTFG